MSSVGLWLPIVIVVPGQRGTHLCQVVPFLFKWMNFSVASTIPRRNDGAASNQQLVMPGARLTLNNAAMLTGFPVPWIPGIRSTGFSLSNI
mmetsp:Transcript_41688/g.107422  ORF Transcript_41688/g.107422 Transcript_41688/m.107422 type:complete len:91 (-) Transcript_41688:1253-1525(-)